MYSIHNIRTLIRYYVRRLFKFIKHKLGYDKNELEARKNHFDKL